MMVFEIIGKTEKVNSIENNDIYEYLEVLEYAQMGLSLIHKESFDMQQTVFIASFASQISVYLVILVRNRLYFIALLCVYLSEDLSFHKRKHRSRVQEFQDDL